MHDRIRMLKVVVFLIILVIDAYSFKGLHFYIKQLHPKLALGIQILFIVISLIFLIIILRLHTYFPKTPDPSKLRIIYAIAGFFIAIYLPKILFSVFHLVEDVAWLQVKLFHFVQYKLKPDISIIQEAKRFHFISTAGLLLSVILLLNIVYGIFITRYKYTLEHVEILYPNLPEELNGFKILQFSDVHLGGLQANKNKLQKAFQLISRQNADIVLFTGDMVNNFAEEAKDWVPHFKTLAPGVKKFSILGNHDYSEYFEWNSEEERLANVKKLVEWEKEMGFKVLLNANTTIEHNQKKIAIIGVENWGLPPFKQYGNLQDAMEGLSEHDFSVLLSHDPTHWDEEVKEKTSIDLTLSGHTHAMQLGIRFFGINWSPSKFLYEKWNGLYRYKNQYLYVNRGLGSIGFPGRIGMPPEITLIELKKPSND